METGPPGQREQLRHDVLALIRKYILERRVRPGDILRLGPIAAEMDTSITPVREALLLLAHDGWVKQELNRGFRVLPIRRKDVLDIYLIWGHAEGELASRAARQATPGDVAQLRAIDAELHSRGQVHGPLALELNRRFHSLIHQIADAPKVEWFAGAARRQVPYEFSAVFYEVPGWPQMNQIQHTPILDAIAAGDDAQAYVLGRDHHIASGRLLISQLDAIDFWDDDSSKDLQIPVPGSDSWASGT